MFESKTDPLVPRYVFLRRFGKCFAFATAVVLIALSIGILGYHHLAGFS